MMKNVSIRRPNKKDIEELHQLFAVTITTAFEEEGVGDDLESINGEVEEKKQRLKEDIASNGFNHFFLLACLEGKIVGTISYGVSSELINKCTQGQLKDVGEIGSVYILPEYQRKGIGTLLLNAMYIALIGKGIDEFCLDSGYTIAKKIWGKKLGEPKYVLKDYWGEGADHLIWCRKLKDISITYELTN
ncbi:GNAT family N-acetyltransferase [Vallitalea okinawensis]|uniref:GNAT family N-acetyltransferase n=1 Tax=Vallitalea okinawensis TaxID=2078660 RepID=UPI001FA81CBF|nr:GNAT family N-acetyltransferase [Vallitalea okinawensis]